MMSETSAQVIGRRCAVYSVTDRGMKPSKMYAMDDVEDFLEGAYCMKKGGGVVPVWTDPNIIPPPPSPLMNHKRTEVALIYPEFWNSRAAFRTLPPEAWHWKTLHGPMSLSAWTTKEA